MWPLASADRQLPDSLPRQGLGPSHATCFPPPGVSKIVTVDVKGSSPLWLKVKDLAEGMTYRFRIRAKTFTYGPEIEANVTTGPGEGRGALDGCGGPPGRKGASRACMGGAKLSKTGSLVELSGP